MSNIPHARRLLEGIAADAPEALRDRIIVAISLLHRRPYAKPVAQPRGTYVDADTAAMIRAYVSKNPEKAIQDVALIFGCNPGRVSEALHWLR